MSDDIGSADLGSPERAAVRVGSHLDDLALSPIRLAVLCSVVEHQSFTRAADDLCVTQQTVSGHIHALEQALGVRMFDRRRRGAQLTEAGRAVYECAVAVRCELTALRAHLAELAGGRVGVVTLGASMVPSTYILPRMVAEYQARYPAAQVRLRLCAPDSIGDEVLRGSLDFGVVSEVSPIPRTLQIEPLWLDTMVIVARADHRLAGRARVTVAELADEPFIAGPARSVGTQALETALARAGCPARRVVLELGVAEGIKQAVLAGAGLAVLFHRVVATELQTGQLVALAVHDLPMTEQFLLVSRRTQRFSSTAQNLRTFIMDRAREVS